MAEASTAPSTAPPTWPTDTRLTIQEVSVSPTSILTSVSTSGPRSSWGMRMAL